MIIGKNLPGFDILVIDSNFDGEVFLTLVQTKWSEPSSETTYGKPGIENSLRNMRKVFKPYVKDYKNLLIYDEKNIDTPDENIKKFATLTNLNSNQIQAVFIILAKITDDLATFGSSKNVLVINKNLEEMYGPTIWSLINTFRDYL